MTLRSALPMPATIRAHAADFRTLDAEAGTVRAVLLTGRRHTVFSMLEFAPVDEIAVLDGFEDLGPFVLFDNHPEKYGRVTYRDVYGHVADIQRVTLEDGTDALDGLATFDLEDADAAACFGKIRRRHYRRVSVGVQQLETYRIAPGDRQTIAGREYNASQSRPLYVTTRFGFIELSTVWNGADPAAMFYHRPDPGIPTPRHA